MHTTQLTRNEMLLKVLIKHLLTSLSNPNLCSHIIASVLEFICILNSTGLLLIIIPLRFL